MAAIDARHSRTTHARTTRARTSVTAALAGMALLGLAACGQTGGSDQETTPEAPTEQPAVSDGGGEAGAPAGDDNTDDADDGATGEDGAATGDDSGDGSGDGSGDDPADGEAEPGAGSGDADENPAQGGQTRILLAADIPEQDIQQDGETWSIENIALAAALGETIGSEATCEGALTSEDGATQSCLSATDVEGSVEPGTWIAHPVQVPADGGVSEGGRAAVLFTLGPQLSEETAAAIASDRIITGVGIGSVYGAEPIPAQQLGDDVLTTLTSEFAYAPVGESYSEVTCEDGLDFEEFEPVTCLALSPDDAEVQVQALPGTFVENDNGVLVSLPDPSAG